MCCSALQKICCTVFAWSCIYSKLSSDSCCLLRAMTNPGVFCCERFWGDTKIWTINKPSSCKRTDYLWFWKKPSMFDWFCFQKRPNILRHSEVIYSKFTTSYMIHVMQLVAKLQQLVEWVFSSKFKTLNNLKYMANMKQPLKCHIRMLNLLVSQDDGI